MKQLVTQAIILSRTDYGEADRIITLLTPDYGKLRLLAKGVRRVKSKLAGGIELFSVSTITFIKGRGEIGTLVSSRLEKHYGHIIEDFDRTMLSYELIKRLHKVTEDQPEATYFELLQTTFDALNMLAIPHSVIRFWFFAQLLRLGGHAPNLQTDTAGARLQPDQAYIFDYNAMCFAPSERGEFTADHIKFLRLAFQGYAPGVLAQVTGCERLVAPCATLVFRLFEINIA